MLNYENPYLKLGNINEMIRSALGYLYELDNKEYIRKLTDVYRKSFIMQLLSDKYIIAVTGIQGVGKTTILKKIYNVEENTLITNQGRGEQIPVLFTETKSHDRKAHLHKIVKKGTGVEIEKIEIKPEEVNKISMDYNPVTDLFLEVEVKEAIFFSPDQHFLLLPGIESQDTYMHGLTWNALRTAVNCVFVMFENAYAKKENTNLIEKIKKEFAESEPIFVLTMADQSTDCNQTFKSKVISELQIEEADRAVISGTSPELLSKWPDEFKRAVQRYSSSKSSTYKIRKQNMICLLDEIDDLRFELKEYLDSEKVGLEADDIRIERYLKPFHISMKNMKSELVDSFKESMQTFEGKLYEAIESRVANKGWAEELWDMLTKRDVTLLREFKSMITECYEKASAEHFVETGFINSLSRVQMNLLYGQQIKEVETQDLDFQSSVLLLNSDVNQENVSQDIISTIKVLYQPNTADSSIFINDQFEKSMKFLPYVFNEMIRLSYMIPELFAQGKTTNNPAFAHNAQQAKQVLEIYTDTKPTMSQLIGLVSGADMAMDGQLDMFNLLESQLPQASASMAAGLTSYLGVALIAVNAISYLDNLVNRTQVNKLTVAGPIVTDMRRYLENQFIKNYERATLVFTTYTTEAIRAKMGLNKKLSHVWNLDQALVVIKDTTKELRGIFNANPC